MGKPIDGLVTTSTESSAPYRSLRGWLRHLSDTDRLALIREGVSLKHELAAIAKNLDGRKATLFPRPLAGMRCRSCLD
jgi:2,5-furandicarboxylate decarboxylase 1